MEQTELASLDFQPAAPAGGTGAYAPRAEPTPLATDGPDTPIHPRGKAMRICLCSHEYPPETARGGIGTQTYLKAHGLAALGHNVHVVSRSIDEKTHRYRDGHVEVTRVPGFEFEMPVHTTEADWLTYSVRVASAVAA